MEFLKRRRTQNRREFTMAADIFQCDIANKVDILQLKINYSTFLDAADSLFKTEESLRDFWLQEVDFDESVYEADQDKAANYRKRWLELKTKYEQIVRHDSQFSHSESKYNNNCGGSDCEDESKRRRFKLPKLELAKYDGHIRNWIPFWGQFKKIHMDSMIDKDDKFQYLLQSMSPNTSARQLVESYPPCGENYDKAIDALKSRFARDELLIESYVRDLLNLVLLQAKGQSYDLRTLYDKLQTHLQALETLGVTKDKYAAMLIPMVESSLPEDILRIWNRSRSAVSNLEINELNSLLVFLKKEVESEERIEISRSGFDEMRLTNHAESPTMAFHTALKTVDAQQKKEKKKTCLWCEKDSHSSSECFKASKMTLEERNDYIYKKKACKICLRTGHNAKLCKSFPKCLYCKKRHLVLMCSDMESIIAEKKMDKNKEILFFKENSHTILPTLILEIFNGERCVKVRALIDSGAQRSFIKTTIAEVLNLHEIKKENISHSLFGGIQTKKKVHSVYDFSIRNIDGNFVSRMMAIGENNICTSLPKISSHRIFENLLTLGISLHDMTIDTPDDVTLLIGADYSGLFMTGNVIQLNNGLTAIETKLGWTVQGMTSGHSNNLTNLFCTSKIDICDLWNLETLGIREPADQISKSDQVFQTLQKFQKSIKVNDEGRYEVELPWCDVLRPRTNYDLAKKRLESTMKRLTHLGKVSDYDSVFKEWVNLDIIEVAHNSDPSYGHYIPHHAVINENRLTTKVRPVFDASCKDIHGISLNSCLEKGENLLELIPNLIIGFRRGAFGVTADITKAFLQISLKPEDREFLKFLWISDASYGGNELITYQHKRVVFGVKSSPFHLVATIGHHLNNSPKEFMETAMKLKNSFYVDNCVTSVETKNEMFEFIRVATQLMKNGKFELRQWVTAPFNVDNTIKELSVLGVMWNTLTDELYCDVSPIKTMVRFTKRSLLSATQGIFDPLGILCPTTIVPKMILQKCWTLKLGWDEELPADLISEVKCWLKDIDYISQIKVPRRLTNFTISHCETDLHTFCDASNAAYSVCIFLRSKYDNSVNIRMVLSKSRVTPVKQNITIPRLELIACVMGVRLCQQAVQSLKLANCNLFFWTDSTVALSWIKGGNNWGVFVTNRVREIRKFSSTDQWFHVPGQQNPADLPSRGVSPKKLLESRWWEGPDWLLLSSDSWPITVFVMDPRRNDELKNKCEVTVTVNINNEYFLDELTYFSKYSKIVRMICWLLRTKKKICKLQEELTYDEIEYAEEVLIKLIQDKHKEKMVKNKNYHIFQDVTGMLRLKTKLSLSDDQYNFKFPIVLPGYEPVVQRLVSQRHIILQHAGVQTLMCNLRQKYWIFGLRKLLKKIVKECVICRRHLGKACNTPAASLPMDRMGTLSAFEVTGVDLAGPLLLRGGTKCWIVLFTCATYRAVHLELVESLSTHDFVMALRRFIARRGRVHTMYSDNGTNFTGLNNLLKSVDWNEVLCECSILRIKWKFIPPKAPWWGGFYERLVGIVKSVLKRVLGRASVSLTELHTVLCDIEATVNSRPLTYISNNVEELKPLTPSLFIQPLSDVAVPDLDTIDGRFFNIRANYCQKLRDDLRQRFRNEYLSNLVHKGKELKTRELRTGDIVLLETESKRTNWPLGMVMETFAGTDGFSRVAKIRTASGFKVRPYKRLFPLEIHYDGLDQVKHAVSESVKELQNTVRDTNDQTLTDTTNTDRSKRTIKLPSRFDDYLL